MKKIVLILIFIILIMFLESCQSSKVEIFQRDDYIVGNITIIEPMLDETFDFPIISSDTYDSVNIVALIGDNVEQINVEIMDSEFFYHYGDYYYKNIKLNITQYQFYESAKIEQIEFQFTKNKIEFNEIFNCEIELNVDTNVIDVSDFATIKRSKVAIPTTSIPSFFWVLYPMYTFTIDSIIDNTSEGYANVNVGISSTTDFNEINDTNLTEYDELDHLNLDVMSRINVYFNLGYNLVKGKYINEINSILLSITINNNQNYVLRILNLNDLSYVKERIEDYIDVGF